MARRKRKTRPDATRGALATESREQQRERGGLRDWLALVASGVVGCAVFVAIGGAMSSGVHSATGAVERVVGPRLSDDSTCSGWRSASLDDRRSYVHRDGYYSDDAKRMTELDQLCATSRDEMTLLALRGKH